MTHQSCDKCYELIDPKAMPNILTIKHGMVMWPQEVHKDLCEKCYKLAKKELATWLE